MWAYITWAHNTLQLFRKLTGYESSMHWLGIPAQEAILEEVHMAHPLPRLVSHYASQPVYVPLLCAATTTPPTITLA